MCFWSHTLVSTCSWEIFRMCRSSGASKEEGWGDQLIPLRVPLVCGGCVCVCFHEFDLSANGKVGPCPQEGKVFNSLPWMPRLGLILSISSQFSS
jgi:hypothetical protein